MWTQGVRTALRDCMEVGSGDRVLVVADRKNADIGRAFLEEARTLAGAFLVLLEDFGTRPIQSYPWPLRSYIDFVKPTVTFFVATTEPGELPLRASLVKHVTSLGARHAHMPGVTKEVIARGLKDCQSVVETTLHVYERVKGAREVEVRTEKGTELYFKVGKYRWVADTGKIGPGEWGNLPGGEVFTTPEDVEGKAVVDGSLGDYFARYGKLTEPIIVHIESGHVVDVEGGPLAEELFKYISSYENGTRVGELGIGTNINIEDVIGNLLLDEKISGVHIAFGDPLGHVTGAGWQADVHVDAVITKTDVVVDKEWLMKGGRFVKV